MSFLEIFQPGLKHLREERERQRMDVAYPTSGADPLMEIDLDAGTARIVLSARSRATADEQAATGASDGGNDTSNAEGGEPDDASGGEPDDAGG